MGIRRDLFQTLIIIRSVLWTITPFMAPAFQNQEFFRQEVNQRRRVAPSWARPRRPGWYKSTCPTGEPIIRQPVILLLSPHRSLVPHCSQLNTTRHIKEVYVRAGLCLSINYSFVVAAAVKTTSNQVAGPQFGMCWKSANMRDRCHKKQVGGIMHEGCILLSIGEERWM